jgi:hypothetical protein
MKHLRILIDAISEYPLEIDVLLFMAVCFLVLVIIAYGMGERANHRFTAERNEAFMRKMRVSISLSSGGLPPVDPIKGEQSSGEMHADRFKRDEWRRETASAEELDELPRLDELSQQPSRDTVRQGPAQAPLTASAPTQAPQSGFR